MKVTKEEMRRRDDHDRVYLIEWLSPDADDTDQVWVRHSAHCHLLEALVAAHELDLESFDDPEGPEKIRIVGYPSGREADPSDLIKALRDAWEALPSLTKPVG